MQKDRQGCDENNPCKDPKRMCDIEEKKCMKKTYIQYNPYGTDTETFIHDGHTYIGKKATIEALKTKLTKAVSPKAPSLTSSQSDVDEPELEPEPEADADEVSLNLDEDIDIESLTELQRQLYECLMKGGLPA